MSNQIYEKTIKDRYVAINAKTISALNKLNCSQCWFLYFWLAEKHSFQNGLIGIFAEITIYEIAKVMSLKIRTEQNTTKVKRVLKKLEKAGLITLFNEKPFIALLTTAEQAENLKSLEEVINYVKLNEKEFFFDVQHKRANEFFESFGTTRLPLEPAGTAPTNPKQVALDTLIQNRSTRTTTRQISTAEAKEATEWKRVILNDEEDPFENHLIKNSHYIRKDKDMTHNIIEIN